jgi:hypothetical protein
MSRSLLKILLKEIVSMYRLLNSNLLQNGFVGRTDVLDRPFEASRGCVLNLESHFCNISDSCSLCNVNIYTLHTNLCSRQKVKSASQF